jgi:hypothetical protein
MALRAMRLLALLLLPALLAGCVRTAAHVVTFPVRATAYGYDKMTTSQAEADRNRGRKMRKQEARERKERRREEKQNQGQYPGN